MEGFFFICTKSEIYFLFLRYTSTATITAAAIPIITNGRIGVLSPVDTAFTELLPFCVPWSEVEVSVAF